MYKDTDAFHYHNANPKNRVTTDCVARAITLGAKKDYKSVKVDLLQLSLETGYDDSDVKCYGKYLEQIGFTKHKQERKANNRKYTATEFCVFLNNHYDGDRVIAHVGGNHLSTFVKDEQGFRIYDVWDCTYGCVGNWWTV